MLHASNSRISLLQSGTYLEQQFRQNLKRAFNPKRKYQAQSIIISFSKDEFNTDDLRVLNQQASQALKLVQGYVNQHFSDTQSVTCVQCDGDGGYLHAHLLINTIKPNGKTVPTSRFSVYRMRRDWNHYLENNFQRVTGRQWQNSFEKETPRKDVKALPTRSVWEEQLKQTINKVKREVHTVTDFLARLAVRGIQVKERGKKRQWTYSQILIGKNGKPKLNRVRAFYQRKDKDGHVIATRGLGKAYTRQSLEKFWEQETKEPIVSLTHHNRKEDYKNGSKNVQSDREQLIKVKTLSREARAAARQRQRRVQLNLQQLRATEAEERKQRSQSQVGSASQGRSNQGRFNTISHQQRLTEAKQQHIREQQERATRTNGKDVGPDL